jgi:hypothetical protein
MKYVITGIKVRVGICLTSKPNFAAFLPLFRPSISIVLGLVRAGIAGGIRIVGAHFLHPATCNSCTQRTLSCHQHIALSTNRLRIEYAEHAERTYIAEIAEIDEGPNT